MTNDQLVPPHRKGILRVFFALRYSWQGMQSAFKNEAAFRQELMLCVLLIPLAFYLEVEKLERLLMILSLIMILIVELLNSAIEAIVDRVCEGFDPYAEMAKDMASAAVFLSLIVGLVTWMTVILL